jgi:hypothetical protein
MDMPQHLDIQVNARRRRRIYPHDPEWSDYIGQPAGPGSELKRLLEEMGVMMPPDCDCSDRAAQMDAWGVEGCRANRDTIVGWLREALEKLDTSGMPAAYRSLARGMVPAIVDEAIDRAASSIGDQGSGAAQLVISANGIGDVLGGLTVAAGWKARHPDRELVLVVPHRQWAELFGGYDTLRDGGGLGASGLPGVPHAWSANNHAGYHFIEAVGGNRERALPPVRPLPADVVEWAEPFRGAVVLAPWTLAPGQNRNWLLSHWLILEEYLRGDGFRCVVIGSHDDPAQTLFKSPVIRAEPAARVAALMQAGCCVVSNESGMAHLAGALQVACIVLAAQLDGRTIHDFWPQTRVLQGPLACSGCRWGGEHYRDHCNSICASLQAITPETVLGAVQQHHRPRSWQDIVPRLNVPRADPTCPLERADRRPTMTAYLGHLAQHGALTLVETGCQRADNDYGAGMSTMIFARWLDERDAGRLVSVDNDPHHVGFARSRHRSRRAEVMQRDSVAWLRDYRGPSIDGIYLDSLDTDQPGFAEHCLAEVQAALPHLAPHAAILIDDTVKSSGASGVESGERWWGKGALAVPWLCAQGWRIVVSHYQTLLIRV